MTKYRLLFSATLLASAALHSNTAFAFNCGDTSELMSVKGNDYYQLGQLSADNVPAEMASQYNAEEFVNSSLRTRDHHVRNGARRLSQLMHSISTNEFKQGQGIRYDCIGVGSNQRVAVSEFTLQEIQRVDLLNGTQMIKALEDYKDLNLLRRQRIDVPTTQAWMTDTNMDELRSTIVYRQKYNHAQTNTGLSSINDLVVPIVELETRVRVSGQSLELSQHRFVGGYRDSWVVWQLR